MKQRLLRDRLVHIFIGIILSASLLAVVGLGVIYRVSISTLYQQTLQTNYFLSDRISQELTGLEEASLDMLSRAETQSFLRNINHLEEGTLPYYTHTTTWAKFSGTAFAFMDSAYKTVGVIDMKHRIHSFGHAVAPDVAAQINQVIATDINQSGAITWKVVQNDGVPQVLCIRAVRDLNYLDLSCIGYLFYLVDFESVLQDSIYNYLSFSQMQSSIYLSGQCIFSDADFDIGASFPVLKEENNYQIYRHGRNQYLLTAVTSNSYDMVYYTAQSINTIIGSLILCRAILLCCVALGALLIFFISFRKTLSVTNRITALTAVVGQVYNDNFKTDVTALVRDEQDEVTILANSFQTLVNQMDTLVNEVLTRKLLFKEAQIRFLQAQINPHFLYNTLDTISALAVINRVPPISAMVSSMASILRYSLNENILSHVGTELEILQKYLLIQQTRYGERLSVLIFVGQDCQDVEIPKMTLQPLLENAIKYSVETKSSPVRIKLRIYKMHNNLVITVMDTGIGMVAETAELLRSKQFDLLPGHGLKNVFLRLNNLFGDRLRLAVRAADQRYTSIRISIVDQGDFTDVEKDKNFDCR